MMLRSKINYFVIVLILILSLLPIICYRLILDDSGSDNHNFQVAQFLNGTEEHAFGEIVVISDFDITPLDNIVKNICSISLDTGNLRDYPSEYWDGKFYIRVDNLSFEEPYLEYRLIKLLV